MFTRIFEGAQRSILSRKIDEEAETPEAPSASPGVSSDQVTDHVSVTTPSVTQTPPSQAEQTPEADPAADVSSDQVKEPSDAIAENQLFLFGAGEQLYYIKETGSDVVIVGDKGEETKKENSDEVYKDAKDKAAELILKFAADKGANAIDVEAVKKYFLKVVEEEKEEGLATTASSDDTSVKSDATGAVVPAEESKDDEDEETGTTIHMLLDGDTQDYEDIIRSRYGWAVAEQFENIMNGKCLEKQNSNALEMIAEFLKKRGEVAVYNELAKYLRKLWNSGLELMSDEDNDEDADEGFKESGDEIEVREGESESTTGMESIARQSVDHMTKHAVESKTSKVYENTRDLFLVD